MVFLCISFMMKTGIWNFRNSKTFLPSLRLFLHLYCSGLGPPHFLPEWVLMGTPSSYSVPVSSSCQLCFTYCIETDQVFLPFCSPQWLCLLVESACFLRNPRLLWTSRCFPLSASPPPTPGRSLFQPCSHIFCLYWWFSLTVTLPSASWFFHPPILGCTIQWVNNLSF